MSCAETTAFLTAPGVEWGHWGAPPAGLAPREAGAAPTALLTPSRTSIEVPLFLLLRPLGALNRETQAGERLSEDSFATGARRLAAFLFSPHDGNGIFIKKRLRSDPEADQRRSGTWTSLGRGVHLRGQLGL